MSSKITESEFEVMEAVWEKSPITGNEIIKFLSQRTDWKPNTVRTLISRLVMKGALQSVKAGKEYCYSPLKTKKECLKEVGGSFLKRFFDGALFPMLTHFINEEKLTDRELGELKKILEKKG